MIKFRLMRMVALMLVASVWLAFGSMPVHAQSKYDPSIAPNAEFAATLNVGALVDSGFLRSAIDTSANPQIEAMINLLKNLTGIDIWNKDMQQVHITGQIDKQETIVAAFEGKFDQQKLLDLIKLNAQFKEISVLGQTGYEWFDSGEKRLKCGLFTANGTALIANSQTALLSALNAGSQSSALHHEWTQLQSGIKPETGFWGCVIVPEHLDLNKFPAAREIKSFTLQIDLAGANVKQTFTANLTKPDNAQQWLEMTKGGMALLALQQNSPTLASLARVARVEQTNSGTAITTRGDADVATLLKLKGELKAMKRANP